MLDSVSRWRRQGSALHKNLVIIIIIIIIIIVVVVVVVVVVGLVLYQDGRVFVNGMPDVTMDIRSGTFNTLINLMPRLPAFQIHYYIMHDQISAQVLYMCTDSFVLILWSSSDWPSSYSNGNHQQQSAYCKIGDEFQHGFSEALDQVRAPVAWEVPSLPVH